jgi:hypothetical protein
MHIFLQRYIEQKVGTGESIPWTQQQIDKGFTGCLHRHVPSFLVIATIFAALLPFNILDLEVLLTKQFVYLAHDEKPILFVLLFSVLTLTILLPICACPLCNLVLTFLRMMQLLRT